MDVENLFTRLSYGELSNLSMSTGGSGLITAEGQPKIITAANEGLLRLYTRFVLSEKEIILEQVDNYTNYHLLPKYAETNTDDTFDEPRYIKDIADPFHGDVIKVLRVYNDEGVELPLNDLQNPVSLFTPNPQMLQVPVPQPGNMLSVVYQARHVLLEYGILGAEIYLPAVLEGALIAYIAGHIYGNMNGADNSAKGQEYMNRFELICKDVLGADAVNTLGSNTDTKFTERGFV